MDNYSKAYQYLVSLLSLKDKHYEITEDTYEYNNGLILIIYEDEAHEIEREHICVDIDSF